MFNIIELSKEEMIALFMYPYYGYTIVNKGVWIRSDLPVSVKASVTAHEMQHYNDNAFLDGRVWHWEMRAWIAGFKASPIGFFQGILLSITDIERISLYLKRIIKGF